MENAIIINGIRHDFTHDEMEIVKGALWVYSQQAEIKSSDMRSQYSIYGNDGYKRLADLYQENGEIACNMAFQLI